MNQATPLLSVIIPTYGRRESLTDVLAALGRQQLPPTSFEAIVSIDGKNPGTRAVLATLTPPYTLRWVEGEHGGPGFARNRGANRARGPLLVFLDDDIVATPALLATHLEAQRRGGPKTVCLGQVRILPSRRLSACERYLSKRFEEHYDKMNRPGYCPDFWDCLSGNFSIPHSLWQASGGFTAAFAAGRHEDVELGYRLQRLGAHFTYERKALAYHAYKKAPAAALRDAHTEGRSACRLACCYPELTSSLFAARWQRYPPPFQAVLRQVSGGSGRLRRLMEAATILLGACERLALPLMVTRPLYQTAFHLHFWQGAVDEGGMNDCLSYVF